VQAILVEELGAVEEPRSGDVERIEQAGRGCAARALPPPCVFKQALTGSVPADATALAPVTVSTRTGGWGSRRPGWTQGLCKVDLLRSQRRERTFGLAGACP
jgi:hypothetical protein